MLGRWEIKLAIYDTHQNDLDFSSHAVVDGKFPWLKIVLSTKDNKH